MYLKKNENNVHYTQENKKSIMCILKIHLKSQLILSSEMMNILYALIVSYIYIYPYNNLTTYCIMQ